MSAITIQLEETSLRSGDACRGRVLLRFREPTDGERVVVQLSASQRIRSPFSTRPPSRCILHESEVEVSGAAAFYEEDLGFELRIPGADELDELPQAPAWLQRFVTWLAPDAIQPVRWEVQARLERKWSKDVFGRTALDVELAPAKRRAS